MAIDLTGLDGKTVVSFLEKVAESPLMTVIVNLTPTPIDNQIQAFLNVFLKTHEAELSLFVQAAINLIERKPILGASEEAQAHSPSELFEEVDRLRDAA